MDQYQTCSPVPLQTMALCKLNDMRKLLGFNLLQINCQLGNLEFVHAVIQCSPSKLDAAILLGTEIINTVLRKPQCSKFQQCAIVDGLIRHGITKNFQTDTLLHEIARRGNLNQLTRLLQNKRACEMERIFLEKDGQGKTPLMWASFNNSVDVIRFLLSNGANLYLRDFSGQTAFLHACRGNTRGVVEFLARKGARIHDIDSDGQHGIHHAARGNTCDVLELLMHKLQADVHIQDWRNRFAIHHAAAGGNSENVLFLIQNSSCLNPKTRVITECVVNHSGKNYGGMTPLHYATQRGHANIVKLLVQHGADINAVTDCGRTACTIAMENGHGDIVCYIKKRLLSSHI